VIMETATQNLERDHEYILQLIEVMDDMVQRKESDLSSLETIVRLIRTFADGVHHAKEEHLLFPALGPKGFSSVQGPVAVMLSEHVQGRAYVSGMAEGIESSRKGDALGLQRVWTNMLQYGALLRAHIMKENTILFRMADSVLSGQEQQELLRAFAQVDAPEAGEGPDKQHSPVHPLLELRDFIAAYHK